MNNKDEIFSVEKVLAKEKELKEHPERNRVKTVTMTAEELYEKIMKKGGSYDAASLCSLAPDADGVSNSHVRIQLPPDQLAYKFDRGFPSVDDIEGDILALKMAVDEEKKEKEKIIKKTVKKRRERICILQ